MKEYVIILKDGDTLKLEANSLTDLLDRLKFYQLSDSYITSITITKP